MVYQKVKDIITKHDNLEKELSSGRILTQNFCKKIKRIFKSWNYYFNS